MYATNTALLAVLENAPDLFRRLVAAMCAERRTKLAESAPGKSVLDVLVAAIESLPHHDPARQFFAPSTILLENDGEQETENVLLRDVYAAPLFEFVQLTVPASLDKESRSDE